MQKKDALCLYNPGIRLKEGGMADCDSQVRTKQKIMPPYKESAVNDSESKK